jgi:alkylation response protein AidB-like acyl-CoA dehydrogenase
MDTIGNKAARDAISQIKVAVPNMALRVIDRAIQMHGGGYIARFPSRIPVDEPAYAAPSRRT